MIVAAWALVVVGLVADVRLMAWYWPGSFFDGPTSDVWTALAWDFAHGEFYRPLVGPAEYGGTRYMPLLFVVHGLLIRAHLDPIHVGVLLMQTSVVAAAVALFAALRAASVPPRLAVPLAGTVWCTVLYQKYCTDLRPDYLAAAFALAGIALAGAGSRERRPMWLVGSSGACVLAGLTKVTAVAFSAPIVVWLWMDRRRTTALRFAVGTLALFILATGVVQVASAGHFLENFRATATGGITMSDVGRGIPKLAGELVSDPFVGMPFVMACWCSLTAARHRRLSFAHTYFVTATLVTMAIFVSPGTVSNQLVDLQMASTLVVGVTVVQARVSPRLVSGMYAALAVVLMAISLPVSGIPSVVTTLSTRGPRSRSVVQAIHAEFLPAGSRYLSTDPIVSVLNDERPVILDAFSLEQFVKEETPAGRDIAQQVRRRAFSAIVLRDTGDFPRDMNAGDSGFSEYQRRYWVNHDDALTRLFRSTYEMRAVRRPFVILTPAPAVS